MQGGMDFPDDITTNVFRVGDIKEIHWAFCTTRSKDKSALQYPLSSEDKEEDLVNHLQSSEDTLREDGHHVFFDKVKRGIWVFCLSQARDEGIARTLSLKGLESTSAGSVSSEELATALNANSLAPTSMKTARSTQPNHKAIDESNTQAYSSNATSSAQSSTSEPSHKTEEAWKAGPGHSVFEIYPKLICAVSSSLSHQLGKEREWVQVGPNSCMDARTLGDDHLDMLELHSYIATTTNLCFDVKWLSSGTMLISFFQVQLPKHTSMSTIISRDSHSTGLAVGSPLLLSPSGVKCQYLGTENLLKSDVQRKSAAKAKASTLSRLAHQGIRFMQEVAWIQVHQERDSNASDGQPVSFWPADLCFCKDPLTPFSCDDGESFKTSIVDASIDPLQGAESWFLGKSAREEALRARTQEEKWGAPAPKASEDIDDEDILSLFEIPIDQGITPQDVSGIYPTPPDGLPSALLGPSHPNNLQSGDYGEEEKGQQLSDEARGDHQEQEDDDLFGDIDIDMFASNGLTEADISFFDDPDMIDEDLRETGPVMALDYANETTNYPMAFDGQDLTITAHEGGYSGSARSFTSKDQEDVLGTKGNDQVFITTEDSLPDKGLNKKLESAVDVDDIECGSLEHLNLHHGTIFQDVYGDQRGSFEHVPFERIQSDIDDKYNTQGRFAFDVDELPVPKHVDRGSHPENHIQNSNIFSEEFPREENLITGESFFSSRQIDPLLIFDNPDDEDEDALTPADFGSHDAVSFPLGLQAEQSRKRKREQLVENDNLATPSSSVFVVESPAGSPREKADEPTPDLSRPNVLEKTTNVVDFGTRSLESSVPSFKGRGQAFIKVAQVVANQAVSGFFQLQTGSSDELNLVGQSIPDHSLQNTMTKLLSALFPTNKRCNLKEYASLGEKNAANVLREQAVLNQRSLKPSHAGGGLTSIGQPIFKIESPYTRVRRNGISTDISASALYFWEELSLGPSYETKDIDAFCLCPKNNFIEEGVMAFLNMIKGAYQSCNLGSHNLGASPADHSKRLVTIHMEPRKPDKFLQDIGAMCDGLGTRLDELGLQSGTTVIYIINPYKDQRYLPGLCAALSRLPNSYGAALEKRRPERQNNIVMQIVPLELVWSPERIVVPSPADYKRLAFEIYNQCGSSESSHTRESNFMRAPAIRLAKAVPKTIDFKLVPESSSPLMQSNNCVHVSYAWDFTSEWLAAIWIDNLGVLSWRACYCLGKNNENPWKPFYEAAKEILETSYVMLYPPNAAWQLFICKDSPMLKSESDAWLRALSDSSRPSISCTILTVDAKPRLTFTLSNHHKSSFDVAPGLVATPGATPQTNTPSPDISGLGSTPAGNGAPVGTPPPNAVLGDHDPEARLIDVTDETWGVIMDGTLGDLSTQCEESMSIVSGYLVKRAGPRDEDGLIPLEVNLVHGQKPYRTVLKDVLGMYRNLSTLARVRGAVDPVKSVEPLHIAAARLAWRVVSETMRYEPE